MDELEPQFTSVDNMPAAPKPSKFREAIVFVWEIAKIIVISLAIIIPIRYFIVQPFFVKGASMENNFQDGDYILIDEIGYRFELPQRGQVVVFRYPLDQSQFFIKRIIGLPGETVQIKDDKVTIFNKDNINGFQLNEYYLASGEHTLGDMKIKLDDHEYFVMGDNRLRSSDSRMWGPVNSSLITGRVFFRAWPFNKITRFSPIKYQ